MNAAQNIAICGVNWLGDACMTMPALQAFHRKSPDVKITMLTRPALRPLWEMHPAITETLPLSPTLKSMRQAARELRERQIETVYLFPNSWRSALVPFFAGTANRIGQAGHRRRILLTETTPLSDRAIQGHQQWEYVDILKLKLEALPEPQITIPEQIKVTMQASLPPSHDTHWVGLLPGAARGPSKQWPKSHFISAAKQLSEKSPCRFVLMGTAAEAELCGEIEAAIGPKALSLAGKTSLQELIAALSLCRTVICNDSGGMHLAATAGTPVVAIYGITDPAKTGPLGAGHKLICAEGISPSRDLPRDSIPARNALQSITPERVVEAVLNTINTRTAKP